MSLARFVRLFEEIDATTATSRKVDAMARYFADAPPDDAAWALFFLSGRRMKRLVAPTRLRAWGAARSGVPEWLFGECYAAVGDIAETVALLVGADDAREETRLDDASSFATFIEEHVLALRDLDEDEQRRRVEASWNALPRKALFVFNKTLTGALRVGVSQRLVVRALAQHSGVDEAVLTHRLMGDFQPSAGTFEALFSDDTSEADVSRPYPFYLASPLESEPSELGDVGAWQAEWKWDGIRAQLVRRRGETHIWTRGEELVTDRYPEIVAAASSLPDGTVLDGELLVVRDGEVQPFAELQRRIGRKKPGRKILADAPVSLYAYDLLEHGGDDQRGRPLDERRALLERLVAEAPPALDISPVVEATSWDELARRRAGARERRVEGLMLKRRESTYREGRRRGEWWKWKVDPLTLDAVLIYAQAGHGRRASLYTDYTFAIWREGELVPIAKAYSGLDDEEIGRLDRWIRRHTIERFGPVRSVRPEMVFELAFEGLRASTRHKSGVALRFPRIARWRHDKSPQEADTIERVQELLRVVG
jgi:DNA ligase-1